MRSPVAELLSDLATALDAADIDWYLFGAQAAILHGVARLTADVDVTVRLPGAMSNELLVSLLEQHDFQPRFRDRAFVERTRVMRFTHAATALHVDVVLAGPGIEDRFFERVETRDVEGVRVRVVSAEDLVVMKVLAGRPKDVDDVRAIVAAQRDRLDVHYIDDTLTLLEAALAPERSPPALSPPP